MEFDGKLDLEQMSDAAEKASALMRTLGHKGRLMVLCHLASGEKSVGELSDSLGIQQSPLSQHLARMRTEGLVTTRRDGQTIYYSLQAEHASKVIECLYGLYCSTP